MTNEKETQQENKESHMLSFKLPDEFVEAYRNVKPEFGYNGLGEVVFLRSYSLKGENGEKETWVDTVRRVTEGVYSIQKDHVDKNHAGWNEDSALQSAKEFFDRAFNMKWSPPGRGWFSMGTKLVHSKQGAAALNNCGFVSTEYVDTEFGGPFRWLMEMGMFGVGPGFDTRGAGKIDIKQPKEEVKTFTVPDSREGWAESVEVLLDSFFRPNRFTVRFDYSKIRAKGEPIKSFGGIAPGPKPLQQCHATLTKELNKNIGKPLSSRLIVDICNIVGKAVVSGGQRRIAEIAFGDLDDKDYTNLKNWNDPVNAERMGEGGWGGYSNNSVFVKTGDDYSEVAKQTAVTGEPGFLWLENAQKFSRMGDAPDWKDREAKGQNPCNEQTLEHKELCTLVEVYPSKHDSIEDFLRTLKFAYLYGKTVTLLKTHDMETNRVMQKNRRIGVGLSGIVQLIDKIGLDEAITWMDRGYSEIQRWDEIYSNWLAVPRSKKTTTVKPSGSVSLVSGVTAGLHHPIGEYYVKRMRISKTDPLLDELISKNYPVEDDVMNAEFDAVVEFPVHVKNVSRGRADVSMWEQLNLAAVLQRHWSDNAVSITVTFDPEREGHDIAKALEFYQYHLKGVSFLPLDGGQYPQMPEEAITKEEYERRLSTIDTSPISYFGDAVQEKFCDSETCLI